MPPVIFVIRDLVEKGWVSEADACDAMLVFRVEKMGIESKADAMRARQNAVVVVALKKLQTRMLRPGARNLRISWFRALPS